MRVAIAGGGAFGTALAIALAANGPVRLYIRSGSDFRRLRVERQSRRLPGCTLPDAVEPSDNPDILSTADIVLLAIPAQALRGFLAEHRDRLASAALVACAKGIDLSTLTGPTAIIGEACPRCTAAVLSGPSFAADIARGLPTAIVLGCEDDAAGARLQRALSTPTLRLYRSTDVMGVELGGALKNVIAIACGAAIGAGLGESARAALMTRGFAEMRRLAIRLDARAETLAGLSGLGDLALTCSSNLSRNYRHGLALGGRGAADLGATVEGAATAEAALRLSRKLGVELPITEEVAGLVAGEMTVEGALRALLDRPLKEE